MTGKLIVESGSTKTDWVVLAESGERLFTTAGINPSSNQDFYDLKEACSTLVDLGSSIDEIHYFGAGVIDDKTQYRVQVWLKKYFRRTQQIQIKSDMMGAALASAGKRKGIICILGTGSNSCLYDGNQIIDNIPALGYILSNEGGGSKIGGELLKAYFYRLLPPLIRQAFVDQYQLSKSTLIERLYQSSDPTAFLASFAKFPNQIEDQEWKRAFLQPIFQEFVDLRIKQYSQYLDYDLYFVGSIAYFYGDVINEVLKNNGLSSNGIIEKPIGGLIDHFKSE